MLVKSNYWVIVGRMGMVAMALLGPNTASCVQTVYGSSMYIFATTHRVQTFLRNDP